jgi:lysophospholipase L1-like esterase
MTIARGDRYVALGSSFAAGPGLKPRAQGSPRAAGRSARNYAHLLAEQRGLLLDDVTFSGATTSDLLNAGSRGPAQVEAVTPETRLITVTAGGNDFGYLTGITLSSLPWPLRSIPSVRSQIREITDSSTMDRRFETLRESLVAVVGRLRERAPAAAIVLVDYLTILPPDDAIPTPGLPESIAEWGRGAAERLSGTMSDIAFSQGCVFLAVGAASRDHHAWSTEPWTQRFHLSSKGGGPYHPKASGMEAVATMLAESLNQASGENR